jgi:hypothetical protein
VYLFFAYHHRHILVVDAVVIDRRLQQVRVLLEPVTGLVKPGKYRTTQLAILAGLKDLTASRNAIVNPNENVDIWPELKLAVISVGFRAQHGRGGR